MLIVSLQSNNFEKIISVISYYLPYKIFTAIVQIEKIMLYKTYLKIGNVSVALLIRKQI